MPNRLDQELEFLHQEVVKLGALCELAVSNATQALLQNDHTLAKSVFELEEQTNKQERDIESLCLKVLLRQHPVAKDLRVLSATLKMITDMERIADQARDIAEIALIMNFSPIKKNLVAMADATLKMVTDSVDCYVSLNLKDCRYVVEYDNVVDDFFSEIQKDVVSSVSSDTTKTLEGMYILMIAKYFERIADHATNVAEWVEFSITGLHKGVNKL